MLHSTKGIVIHSIKYSESSVIVKIYTNLFGLQSYLIKGIRNPKSKIKPGLFQALTLLDLVVYYKEKSSLQSVKEIMIAHPYQTIPFDIRKSSVALFINELVFKAVREEEANPALFDFMWSTCLQLDETDLPVSNFHLLFALQLCHHLGIFPQTNFTGQCSIFNLREGLFQSFIPEHPHYLDPENSKRFNSLLELCSLEEMENSEIVNSEDMTGIREHKSALIASKHCETPFPAGVRDQLLEIILIYYKLHLPGFRGIQSHHVLREVLS